MADGAPAGEAGERHPDDIDLDRTPCSCGRPSLGLDAQGRAWCFICGVGVRLALDCARRRGLATCRHRRACAFPGGCAREKGAVA